MSLLEEAFLGKLQEEHLASAVVRCRRLAKKLMGKLFKEQRDLILDPWRHKSMLCARRAGKSYALAVYMLVVGLTIPNANIVFIARTRDKAKDILWDTAQTSLRKLDKEFEIHATFSEVHTSLRLPNGSRIRLRGCETIADVEQYRGEPFHLVVIDECASFTPGVLDHLLQRAIEPTLGDFLGTCVLSGTPGPFLSGPFYRATGDPAFVIEDGRAHSRPYASKDKPQWAGVEFAWSFHGWGRANNVTLPHLASETQRIMKINGWTDQNPIYLREFVGRWVADGANMVYAYDPDSNIWIPGKRTEANPFGLPEHVKKPHYVLGADFGTKDPFAMTVMAYDEHVPILYQVHEFPPTVGLLPDDFAYEIKRIREMVHIDQMVGDFGPFGDLLQQELLVKHGLLMEKAVKKDKRDHIELLNADFKDRRCFMLPDSEAARQMLHLTWDKTGLKERLSKEIRNDAADAALYTRRFVFHLFAEAEHKDPEPGTREFEEMIEKLEAEEEARKWRAYQAAEGEDSFEINEGDKFQEDFQW